MRLILVVAVGVLVAWSALFLTSHGILIRSTQHRPSGLGQDVLICSYFTGTFVDQEFWYSPNNILGRSVCPRLHDFSN
jgi:hypothetical protein